MKVIMMLGLLEEVRVITLKYYYSDGLRVCDLESYCAITTGATEDCTAQLQIRGGGPKPS